MRRPATVGDENRSSPGRFLAHGDWVLAGFDLAAAACGIGLGAIAWVIGKRY